MEILKFKTSTTIGLLDKMLRLVGSILVFYLSATTLNLQDFGKFQAAVSLAVVLQTFITLSLRGYLTDKVGSNTRKDLESFFAHFKFLFFWGAGICVLFIALMDIHAALNWLIVSFLIAKLLEPIYYLYDATQRAKIYLVINLTVYVVMTAAKTTTLLYSGFELFLLVVIAEQLIIVALHSYYIGRIIDFVRPYLSQNWRNQINLQIVFKVSISGALVVAYSKSDIIMLSLLTDDNNVGIYSVSQKFFELILMIPVIFTLYEFPKVKSLLKDSESNGEKFLVNKSRKFFHIVLIMAFSLILFTPFLIASFFGENFIAAVYPAIILIISAVISTIGTLFSRYAYHLGLLNYLLSKSFIALFLNVSVNFLLIPSYGLLGASCATLLSLLFADIILDYWLKDGLKLSRLKLDMIFWFK